MISVISDGNITTSGEIEGAVDNHFFASRFAEGFGPFEFARVALHFEIFMAFAATEAEESSIIADEGYAFAGIAGLRTEITRLDPLYQLAWLFSQNWNCKSIYIPHDDGIVECGFPWFQLDLQNR